MAEAPVMENYWEIVVRDGSTVEIVPSAVGVIRKRWDEGKPIHLPNQTIPAHQIVDFRETAKPYGQPLLEAAAQAFNEPMENPDGSTIVRWVKKPVTQRDYTKMYSAIPAYRSLGEDRGMVLVAFRLPIHEIDIQKVSYCTDEEIARLEKH
jgi:hypothetical protein